MRAKATALLLISSAAAATSSAVAQAGLDPGKTFLNGFGETDTPAHRTDENEPGGLDHVGYYVMTGLGSTGIHYRTVCPRYHVFYPASGEPAIDGCSGTEPINYYAHPKPLSVHFGLGWRFSRYIALEFPLTMVFFRTNDVRNPSTLEQVTDLTWYMDFQARLHANLPLTRQFALFGTVGVGVKSFDGQVTEPVTESDCLYYIKDKNGFTECAQSGVKQPVVVINSTRKYIPISVGMEWWPWRLIGFSLGYQPPMGRNFAASDINLNVLWTIYGGA